MTTPVYDQDSFRGRDDDGSQTAATWKAVANINWSQATDANFRVRFLIQETAGGMGLNQTFAFQYNLNSAGWVDVTTTSSVLKSVGSANFTDEDATTQQIGAGTFITGAMDDDALAGTNNQIDFAGSDETEVEACFQIVGADVSNGDTLEIRVVKGDLTTIGYTNIPAITVSLSAVTTNESVTDGLFIQENRFSRRTHFVEDDLLVSDASFRELRKQATDTLALADALVRSLALDQTSTDGVLLGDAAALIAKALKTYSVLGPRVYPQPPYGSFSGKAAPGTVTNQTATDGLFLLDSAFRETFGFQSDGLFLADSDIPALARLRAVLDGLLLGENVLFQRRSHILDSLLLLDALFKRLNLFQTDQVLLVDSAVADRIKVLQVLDGLLLQDQRISELRTLGFDSLVFADFLLRQAEMIVQDGLLLGDSVTAAVAGRIESVTATDGVILSDQRLSDIDRVILSNLLLASRSYRAIMLLQEEGILTSDDSSLEEVVGRLVTDAILLVDNAIQRRTILGTDSLLLDDNDIREMLFTVIDQVLFGEPTAVTVRRGRTFADGLYLTDSAIKERRILNIDQALLDAIVYRIVSKLTTDPVLVGDSVTVSRVAGVFSAALIWAQLQALDLLGMRTYSESNMIGANIGAISLLGETVSFQRVPE